MKMRTPSLTWKQSYQLSFIIFTLPCGPQYEQNIFLCDMQNMHEINEYDVLQFWKWKFIDDFFKDPATFVVWGIFNYMAEGP